MAIGLRRKVRLDSRRENQKITRHKNSARRLNALAVANASRPSWPRSFQPRRSWPECRCPKLGCRANWQGRQQAGR